MTIIIEKFYMGLCAMSVTPNFENLYPTHIQRLQEVADKAMAVAEVDSLLIHSGAPRLAFLDDYHAPFKANPHFLWWLPLIHNPHCYLLIRTGKKPVLFYHQADDFWHVPPQPPAGYWCDHVDIHNCTNSVDVKQLLNQLQLNKNTMAWIGEDVALAKDLGINNANAQGLLQHLHYHRSVKSQYEIACIGQANKLALAGHQAAREAFLSGKSEFQTHLAYLAAVQQDQQELPYRNIIGFGAHSAILHYQLLDYRAQNMGQAESFLIDAGAHCNGYAADITRCHSRNSGLYSALIDAMTKAQQSICKQAQPGVLFTDLHQHMHELVLDMLLDFDLVKGSRDELEASQLSSAFFPHGLGHLLGLQVHDIGGWQVDELGKKQTPPKEHPFLRFTRPLLDNMVITIEPGLYVIHTLLQQWRDQGAGHLLCEAAIDRLRPLGGVRIEDNLVVANNPINLSVKSL